MGGKSIIVPVCVTMSGASAIPSPTPTAAAQIQCQPLPASKLRTNPAVVRKTNGRDSLGFA